MRTPNILSYKLRCADDPEGDVHDIMPADELAKRMPEFAALLTDPEFHSLSYCIDLQSVEVAVFEYAS